MSELMRQGVVTQVLPVLKVRIGANTVATVCTKNKDYAPALGDRVVLLVQGGDRWVAGAIG